MSQGETEKGEPGFLQHQQIWQAKFTRPVLLIVLLEKLFFPSSHQKNDAQSIFARRKITILPGVCLLCGVGFSGADTSTPWWERKRPRGADPLEIKSPTNSLLQLNFVHAHHQRSSGCFHLPSTTHLSEKPHEML